MIAGAEPRGVAKAKLTPVAVESAKDELGRAKAGPAGGGAEATPESLIAKIPALGLHAREREGMLPIAPLLERDREQTV